MTAAETAKCKLQDVEAFPQKRTPTKSLYLERKTNHQQDDLICKDY
jgi:hypothetical protein